MTIPRFLLAALVFHCYAQDVERARADVGFTW